MNLRMIVFEKSLEQLLCNSNFFIEVCYRIGDAMMKKKILRVLVFSSLVRKYQMTLKLTLVIWC